MIRNRMESPNEGRVLKICDEPEWPNEGVCVKMYDESESPNEEAYLGYM